MLLLDAPRKTPLRQPQIVWECPVQLQSEAAKELQALLDLARLFVQSPKLGELLKTRARPERLLPFGLEGDTGALFYEQSLSPTGSVTVRLARATLPDLDFEFD